MKTLFLPIAFTSCLLFTSQISPAVDSNTPASASPPTTTSSQTGSAPARHNGDGKGSSADLKSTAKQGADRPVGSKEAQGTTQGGSAEAGSASSRPPEPKAASNSNDLKSAKPQAAKAAVSSFRSTPVLLPGGSSLTDHRHLGQNPPVIGGPATTSARQGKTMTSNPTGISGTGIKRKY